MPNSPNRDRSFNSSTLRQARAIAAQYQIVVRVEDGHFYGRGMEFPTAMGDGKAPDQCIRDTRNALIAAVAYVLEKGDTPPAPAIQGKRDQQVNIRLTSEERLILEASARQQGFTGLADYMRAAALGKN